MESITNNYGFCWWYIYSIHGINYPLVNVYIAMENGPVEIVDFPINSTVIFNSYVKLPEGTGWWFQTVSIVFHYRLGIILPIDSHIFQDGWNHQPD